MIVRIFSHGTSFKGLAAYLTHDPKSDSDERVAWTHTHNLASDEVPGAVNEMLWTARDAELLKQEAGIRAGGRASENPVKHISLNWSPEDDPSREHMIATSEEFLRHMKWQDHQAVLIAHDDKTYAHVHIMLNSVHPETGLHLNDGFEQRRAQAWALGYEKENGHVYCEQRLKEPREREDAPPRNVWMAFRENQQEFESAEKAQAQHAEKINAHEKNPGVANFDEWKMLKDIQRRERETFFADGKSEFSQLRSSIYGEVREEFRERWADYYAEWKSGADDKKMAEIKAQLVADQKEMLDARRGEACAELRESRDELYKGMLDEQRQTRNELRGRQEEGWDNTGFFQALEARNSAVDLTAEFREAARSVTVPEARNELKEDWAFSDEPANDNEGPGNTHVDLADEIGLRMGLGAVSLFEIAFRAFEGTPTRQAPQRSDTPKGDLLAAAAATTQREQQERDTADEEWRKRQRSLFGE